MVDSVRPQPARLLIVDDHNLVRSGFRALLSGYEEFEIVGEAANGREALVLCGRLNPDLILMDVRMPEMDGLEATREIRRRFCDIRVLILTTHESEDYLLEAIRAGAAGYVLKDAPEKQLVVAIRKVLEGECALNRNLATKLLGRLAVETQKTALEPDAAGLLEPLTPRELEVLQLMAHGYTNRKIAEELVVSLSTVKNHVERVLAKLGTSDRTRAVVRAIELGIVKLPAGR